MIRIERSAHKHWLKDEQIIAVLVSCRVLFDVPSYDGLKVKAVLGWLGKEPNRRPIELLVACDHVNSGGSVIPIFTVFHAMECRPEWRNFLA